MDIVGESDVVSRAATMRRTVGCAVVLLLAGLVSPVAAQPDPPLVPGCPVTLAAPPTTDSNSPAVINVTVVLDLARDVSQVAKAIDAQNWDRCAPFFKETFLAKKVGDTYPVDPVTKFATPDDPLPSGSAYHRVLFELWSCYGLMSCNSSWFMNLLDIDASRVPATGGPLTEYEVAYCLNCDGAHWLDGAMGGMVPMKLLVDDGAITAEQTTPGHTRVTMKKNLALDNVGGFLMAYGGYKAAGNEVAREVAQVACCTNLPP